MTMPYLSGLILLTALLSCGLANAEQPRQNSFNADNYQPRGAVNSLPPPGKKTPVSPPKTNQAAASVQRRKVDWSWNSHSLSNQRGPAGQRGVFYYQQYKGRIETSRLCDNYRPGSLVYRDCRKAAKAYFTRQCSSRFLAACGAAGMTP